MPSTTHFSRLCVSNLITNDVNVGRNKVFLLLKWITFHESSTWLRFDNIRVDMLVTAFPDSDFVA